MRETKVNLKHLLEDIRDSYSLSLAEVIVVELIANALDSGACRISFFTDPSERTLTIVDNGRGMKRKELVDYHNIAATTKSRGKGIGFAGVGAKLSLLVASSVLTETKGSYGSRGASQWYLKNETSAPWRFVPFSGKTLSGKGTAVIVRLKEDNSPLLSEEFVGQTAFRHFYPLFEPQAFQLILRHVYKKGVEFFVNNKKLSFAQPEHLACKNFQIRLGGRFRKLAGCGYLAKPSDFDKLSLPGLGISTFGKVIKAGWEWIGLGPKENDGIYGLVEVPALSEILTTNKMDFLKDATSLKKYYRYRKAIQEAILPILKDFGQELTGEEQKKQFRTLSLDIERALRGLLSEFPELMPLLGIRKSSQRDNFGLGQEVRLVGLIEEEKLAKAEEMASEPERREPTSASLDQPKNQSLEAEEKESKKGPALSIGFETGRTDESLARIVKNKIWVNTTHPAYLKAQQKNLEPYHIVFCVGWVLSNFLDDNRSPQTFIDNFLASWGRDKRKTSQLLKI